MEFEALYDRYARRLLGWAVRRTALSDAEDLIQEALLAIHRSLPEYRGESGLDAWVFGVARNVWRVRARDRARLKRAAPTVPLDEVAASELLDPRTPADILHAGRSLARVVEQGIAQLGPAEWNRLLEYSLEYTTLDELVRETGVSREAWKSRISRARGRLLEACPDVLPS